MVEIASVPSNAPITHIRGLKRCMLGSLNGVRDIEALRMENIHDDAILALNEAHSPLMFWYITLFVKRQLYTYMPEDVLYPAEVIIELLHKQSELSTPVSSPFHYHFLALAVVTLLEITDIPELSHHAWAALDRALHIITQREKHTTTAGEFGKIFATQGWEDCIRGFVEAKLTKVRAGQFGAQAAAAASGRQPGADLVGPTEQRSLQHLADLAVGAGGNANTNTTSPPRPGSASNAVAEEKDAHPDAAKQSGEQRVFVDFTLLGKKGYLNVLAGN